MKLLRHLVFWICFVGLALGLTVVAMGQGYCPTGNCPTGVYRVPVQAVIGPAFELPQPPKRQETAAVPPAKKVLDIPAPDFPAPDFSVKREQTPKVISPEPVVINGEKWLLLEGDEWVVARQFAVGGGTFTTKVYLWFSPARKMIFIEGAWR